MTREALRKKISGSIGISITVIRQVSTQCVSFLFISRSKNSKNTLSGQQNAKPADELARSARWSGGVTLGVGVGNLAVVLGLTRLLNPADFGTPALGLAALGFALLFVQNGLPGAVIFLQEQDRSRLSGLLWSNVAIGMAGSLLLWLLRQPLAVFFEDDRLREVLALLALLPSCAATGAVYKSILLRNLAYRHIAGAELSAFVAGAVTALSMALGGYGYWALVGQMTAKYLVEYAWYVLAGWSSFRPALYWRREALRPHFRFALAQSGERLTMYLNANWDTLLIGKLLGAEALGIYDVFKRLVARPTSMAGEWIDRFAFPLMARVKSNREELAGIYLGHLRLLSMLLAPFALFGLAFANQVLTPLTGPEWASQAHVFRLLLLAFCIDALLHPLDGMLSAAGKIERLGYANLIRALAAVPALAAGSVWGLEGVATAVFALAAAVQYPLFHFLIKPQLGISTKSYFAVPARAILWSVILLLPAWGVYLFVHSLWPAAAWWAAGAVYGVFVLLRFGKWMPPGK